MGGVPDRANRAVKATTPLPQKKDKGCVSFDKHCIDEWLCTTTLSQDVTLTLDTQDLYEAHAMLRHVQEVNMGSHCVTVVAPPALRRHKGFTPWLVAGKTVAPPAPSAGERTATVCALAFVAKARHVHSAHFATFDVRVGGKHVRVLVDTGATCSCIGKEFARSLGLGVTKDPEALAIGGVGGSVTVLGSLQSPVKVGKFQCEQFFNVVDEPVAGYDVLLGQDFLRLNYGGVQFTPFSVCFNVGNPKMGSPTVTLSRRLEDSLDAHVVTTEQGAGSKSVLTIGEITAPDTQPASKNETKRLLADIKAGTLCAYRVVINPLPPESTRSTERMEPGIQAVIDRHSRPGKTLCGKIPDHTHARGFTCDIELVAGAHPVSIRQYRLTPLEKEELLKRVDDYVSKGWIEPSSSSWSSSVLFVPKPGGKLRFCVDFRALNQRTVVDAGNIPHQSELIDSLQGASIFSALDLASGFYQLAMGAESRAVTAFPTPYG